ncbi:MAG TPA: hypothetical protein ENJ18_02135 [Nannocystis exedens]|nr:hypothetical protein [Nannocystis exedens]
MSLYANIDHLAGAAGIEALAVDAPEKERLFRGLERWHPVLEGAITLLQMTGETSIRLVIGTHTMVVQHELKETVAVVIPTGHAIAKSLRRMIRRMARKDRGPYIAPTPAPALITEQASAPAEPPSRAPTPPQASPPMHSPVLGQHNGQQPATATTPPKSMSNGWGDRFSS